MFGITFSSSTSSSNYPLKITALTVASPIPPGHSKLQHFPHFYLHHALRTTISRRRLEPTRPSFRPLQFPGLI
jgi:hypothetical protein